MYHLRQSEPLSKEKQDQYFEEVVARLFQEDRPSQLLFSFLKGSECIGYGGLVHINWIDSHAEISFIMATDLEANYFAHHWKVFLGLIEQVAFVHLELHKLFTYAYEIRTNLFPVLQEAGFKHEATLKGHTFFNNSFIDVLIHTKFNRHLTLRLATPADVDITYAWLNDAQVRKYSFSQDFISFESHQAWFIQRLNSEETLYYIAMIDNEAVGSFRADQSDNEAVVSFLLSPNYHGRGLGLFLLAQGIKAISSAWPTREIVGYVKAENGASASLFRKLNFSESVDSGGATLKFTLRA